MRCAVLLKSFGAADEIYQRMAAGDWVEFHEVCDTKS